MKIQHESYSPRRRGPAPPDTVDLWATWPVEAVVYPSPLGEQVTQAGLCLDDPGQAARVMLFGPPGYGKTATLRNWSTQCRRPFWRVRQDRLFTSFLGGSSGNVKRLFDAAAGAGAVLIFDDLDAFARRRDDNREGGEPRRAVVALLTAMDESTERVPVVAATNLPASIDPALLRRFDQLLGFGPLGPAGVAALVRTAGGLSRVPADVVRLAAKLSPAEVCAALRPLKPVGGRAADVAGVLRSRIKVLAMIKGIPGGRS